MREGLGGGVGFRAGNDGWYPWRVRRVGVWCAVKGRRSEDRVRWLILGSGGMS